jgi:hypothetical protein
MTSDRWTYERGLSDCTEDLARLTGERDAARADADRLAEALKLQTGPLRRYEFEALAAHDAEVANRD